MSQPLEYYFTLEDYVTYYTGINQCGADKNYWNPAGATTDVCAMSGYFGGTMNVAYSLVNLDPTYSRIYNIQTHSAYL